MSCLVFRPVKKTLTHFSNITSKISILLCCGGLWGCSSTGNESVYNSAPVEHIALQVQRPSKYPKLANKVLNDAAYLHYTISAIKRDDSPFVAIVLNENPRLLNANDVEGGSLLHLAATYQSYQCFNLLIQRGADINRRDNFGETVADLASFDTRLAQIIKQKERQNHE